MSKNTILTDKNWFDENLIEPEAIQAHEVVESQGRFHKPISSGLIVTKFRDKAQSLGLQLINEQGRLKKDGMRFMYTAEIADAAHPDYNMSIGFVNHNDESKAFCGALGTRILVCHNSLITNIVVPSKQRHTNGNFNLIDGKIGTIFDAYINGLEDINGQINLLKKTKLTDQILGQFALEAHKLGTIGNTNIFRIIDDVIKPELNDRSDSSLWRLSNACTKVSTHIITNPERQAEMSKQCHDIVMRLADPSYKSSFIDIDAVAMA